MNLHTINHNGIDGKQFVVLDGRIANGSRLASELQAQGKSMEDVVHAAFLAWGDDFLTHLDGSFALALFDMDQNRLILARDRFGTVPLYFTTGKTLAFSSRTDDFLQRNIVPRTASCQAIWDYLTLGAIPQPNTIIAHVESLRPAEVAVIDLATHHVERRRWWSLQEEADRLGPGDSTQPAVSFQEAAKELRTRLDKALQQQADSFANARLLLSGGIDSTLLLTALNGLNIPIKTLTLGYEQKHSLYDETPLATAVAEHFKAEARRIELSDWDVSKYFQAFIKSMDQPSRDGLNMFHAARLARAEGADAVVTGLGGDELFNGYSYCQRHAKAERLARCLGFLRPVAMRLPDRFRHNLMLPFLSVPERLATIRAQMYEEAKKRSVNPEFWEGKTLVSWLQTCQDVADESLDCLRQLSLFDLSFDMDHTLLRDGFLHTSSQKVALLVPMLDASFATYGYGLPSRYKLSNNQSKAVLVEAYRNELPPCVFQASKRGFEMPLLKWLGSTLLPRAKAAFNSKQAKFMFANQDRLNWSERLTALRPRDYPLWSRFILLEYLQSRSIETFE